MKLHEITLAATGHLSAFAKLPLGEGPMQAVEFDSTEVRDRTVACVQACHGLDLPDTVPPGILADIVHAIRCAVDDYQNFGSHYGYLDELLRKLTPVSGLQAPAVRPGSTAAGEDKAAPVSPDAKHGVFRKAVKTALGDLEESLLTWYDTEADAAAKVAKMNNGGNTYFTRPLAPGEGFPSNA